jgi:hypothetical protein
MDTIRGAPYRYMNMYKHRRSQFFILNVFIRVNKR